MPDEPMREIRAKLTDYLSGVSSLSELSRWAALALWGVDEWTDASAVALAEGLELCLAQFSDGVGKESDLRAALRELVAESDTIIQFELTPPRQEDLATQGNHTVNERALLGSSERWFIKVPAA